MNDKNLFLDDFRHPPDVTWAQLPPVDWSIVRSVESFKKWVSKHGVPSLVSFDNDLLPEHYVGLFGDTLPIKDTGFEACRWLVDLCELYNVSFPDWIVHSRNTRAVRRMVDFLLHREISWDKGITWSYK
jgi:hypothetical protein